jgi:excisionase family DNA binding protein
MTNQTEEQLRSVKHTAQRLDISHWTIIKWIQLGKITSHKLGGRRLVPESEINRLIEESRAPRLMAQ